MVSRLGTFLTSLVLGLALVHFSYGVVTADHNVYLPLTPNTPYIQNILADGETVWCLNAAAHNYPNFRTQRREVYQSGAVKLGVSHRELTETFETAQGAKAAGCEVWHVGRYDNFCTGCAGNIFYANWPIQVNYKLSLGYFEWKTTGGHEDGHAYGLHEQYKDSSGTIGCDAGYNAMVSRLGFPTVMSCGTGVWELQVTDLDRICSLWGVAGDRFHACAPAPSCEGPTADWGGNVTAVYNTCDGIWYASNGYTYSPSTGWWGFKDVGFSPCDAQYGLRQIPAIGSTMPGLHSIYVWSLGYWLTVPAC